MRVAMINETYSKKMGYSENCLSKALAKLGVDVHLIVLPLPPYYYMEDFQQTYGSFNTMDAPEVDVEEVDGYTVHYLKPEWLMGRVRMKGLGRKLKEISPDIVQTFSVNSWIPIEAATHKVTRGYKLFTATSYQASVFPLAQRTGVPLWDRERLHALFLRTVPGRVISLLSEACYGATVDCSDVAVRFFGVQKSKMRTDPFGVDTDVFYPVNDQQERARTRADLGFGPDDIVCVYSGRFAPDKNPLALAQAVAKLRAEGLPYRSLFIGNGKQEIEIAACDGAVLHSFVEYRQLGRFFRAADIGVWPAQESVSMLDAAACGLPLVVNDTMVASERINGNGLTFELGNVTALADTLRDLSSANRRAEMGRIGAERIQTLFSWSRIARQRLADYLAVLDQ